MDGFGLTNVPLCVWGQREGEGISFGEQRDGNGGAKAIHPQNFSSHNKTQRKGKRLEGSDQSLV